MLHKLLIGLAGIAFTLLLLAGCGGGEFEPGFREDLAIPMRDGVTLIGDAYLPGPGQYPAIVEITPYGRGDHGINFRNEAGYWGDHGYAMVLVDSRGQGESEGEFALFGRSGEDGHDVVEWIARQPWSNGRVAMRGASYTGTNQLYTALEQPPHLSCITPSATAWGPRKDLPYGDGILRFGWAISWPANLASADIDALEAIDWDAALAHGTIQGADKVVYGKPSAVYRQFLARDAQAPQWDPLHLEKQDYGRVHIPSLAFTGWFDGTRPGTIAHYLGLERHSMNPDEHFLVVGPWEHFPAPDGGYDYLTGEPIRTAAGMTLPDQAFLPGQEITREFFDWCLKGKSSFHQPGVRLYLTGSHEWLEFTRFPLGDTRTRSLYLAGDGDAAGPEARGALAWQPPDDDPPDSFAYDPRDPVRSPVFNPGQDWQMPSDRSDVLTYTSAPFEEAQTILGGLELELHVSSEAQDTDFSAAVHDIAPDGSVYRLHPKPAAFVRARYRNGLDAEIPLIPGQPTLLRFEFSPVGHTVRAGHRLRVTVSSSVYPWIFPNNNSGNAPDGSTAVTRQTLYHDTERPSRLLLPVFTAPGE